MQHKKRIHHPSGGEKLTQQQFGESANINTIMQRHLKGGPLQGPGLNTGATMKYGYLSGETYHEMLVKVQNAQGAFASLPSRIRKRFANNPENLFSFMQDENNLQEAIDLGLLKKEDVSPEKIQQIDLAREADIEDKRLFEEFKANRRKDNANIMPNESDEEANPRKSRK